MLIFYSFFGCCFTIWFFNCVNACFFNFNSWLWFLILKFHFTNHIEKSESFNDTTENNCLSIQELEWSLKGNIKLAFICIWYSISLAHTEKTWFVMPNTETFISKFCTKYGKTFASFGYK